jgi:ABC-type polysaccharide/polyol phosphate export permease
MKQNSSLMRNLVTKQLKLKFKQSVLGFQLSLLTALVFLLFFKFVFTQVFLTLIYFFGLAFSWHLLFKVLANGSIKYVLVSHQKLFNA